MNNNDKVLLKLTSYLLSLLPLIIIFLIKAFDLIINLNLQDWLYWFFIIFGGIYITSVIFGLVTWSSRKNGSKFPVTITNVRNSNTEQILYFVTYLIPLISIDYDRLTFIQLLLSLVLMGFIYCKTNLFFANPFLSLIGWNIYKAHIKSTQFDEDAIIMTKKSIREVQGLEHSGLYLIDEEVILVI